MVVYWRVIIDCMVNCIALTRELPMSICPVVTLLPLVNPTWFQRSQYGLFYSKNRIKAGQILITASDDVIATLELCIDTCLGGFQRGHFLEKQIDFN